MIQACPPFRAKRPTPEEKARAKEQELENLYKEFRDSVIHFPMFHSILEEEFKIWKGSE